VIDFLGIKARDKGLELSVPSSLGDLFLHLLGLASPVGSSVRESQLGGDSGQSVATCPAHGSRVGVSLRSVGLLSSGKVWLVVDLGTFLSQNFESVVEEFGSLDKESSIKEDASQSQESSSVNVVVGNLSVAVSEANGTDSMVTWESVEISLVKSSLQRESVNRVDLGGRLGSVEVGDDVREVLDVSLDDGGSSELVESLDDPERVSDPAVSEILVGSSVGLGGMRNGGRQSSNDGSSFLKVGHLDGDGRLDDLVLPLEGNGKVSSPGVPVVEGLVEVAGGQLLDGSLETLVGHEDEVDGLIDLKQNLIDDVGDGCIGGQSNRHVGQQVSDVVASSSLLGSSPAVSKSGAQLDGSSGSSGNGSEDSDDHVGSILSARGFESGQEVLDFNATSLRVVQLGADDGAVSQVLLLALLVVGHRDAKESNVVTRFVGSLEKTAKDGISIKSGEARPDDLGLLVDQGRTSTVSNDSEIEAGLIDQRRISKSLGVIGSTSRHCSMMDERFRVFVMFCWLEFSCLAIFCGLR